MLWGDKFQTYFILSQNKDDTLTKEEKKRVLGSFPIAINLFLFDILYERG